ncbi:MAG: outer membrane receptor protein involved in Fe transport, partial [Limisphaerales bacterium]
NIELYSKSEELEILVISGSQYEKPIEYETISLEVISPSLIENSMSVQLSDAIQKAPGVYLLDGQANIRGGTGFTYGAGSRVLVVVDDQSMLTADRNDVKWAFIPMENLEQIEVIKGASSVLYGSSALNGVIHVITAWPDSKPESGIDIYTGITEGPDSLNRKWWDSPPYRVGVNAFHRRKFEQIDLVLGGHFSREVTHLQGEENTRARISIKTRFRPVNNDNLSYGFAANAMYNNEGSFLIWANADSGAYQPFGGLDDKTSTILDWRFSWFTFDPFLTVFDKRGGTHKLKGRVYNNNTSYGDTTGTSFLANLDYRYVRKFFRSINITAGANLRYGDIKDGNMGTHTAFLGGAFVQVDKRFFNRLSANFGLRAESFYTDSAGLNDTSGIVPIFKAGLNYEAGKSFIRASFGQGFRPPSLVERYSSTNVGALQIYPNTGLKPEYGWNAEVGVKRVIRGKDWQGYADAAVYWTEYFDMTEFVFDNWGGPGPTGLGFRTINIGRARMMGLELTTSGSGKIGEVGLNLTGGYNYVYPADLSADSTNRNVGTFLGNVLKGITATDSSFTSTLLRYRFRHTFKIDAEATWKRFRLGFDLNYFSYMNNIDEVFEVYPIPPGIPEFRAIHNRGDWILGARIGFDTSTHSSFSVLVRNVFNREYALRVGRIDPPRNYTIQYRLRI